MQNIYVTLFTTFLARIFLAEAIIGYDCSEQVSNLTTFSLIDVGECDIPEPQLNATKPYIKLLQLNDFVETHVKLCKVEIKRKVQYCGAFSHTKDVRRGEIKFIDQVTQEECKRMHAYRTHQIRDEQITDLNLNGTRSRSMTFAGSTDGQGSCTNAGSYTDDYGTFDDVLVTGYVKITLQDYTAPVNLNTNEIILRSGTRCALNSDSCLDIEAGYAFWDPLPVTACEQSKYSELFEGYANRIVEEGSDNRPVYMVETEEITFAFSTLGTTSLCGYDLIRTEHPKLFIIEGTQAERFSGDKNPKTNNLDIFAYINSKFVYVEKHIKGQIRRLYHDLILQKCELEKKVITNALAIAATQPDLFALQVMKQAGYMGLVAGEVVHIMKCLQVDVKRREVQTCYQELPVTKDEKEYFLMPRTHILKQFGTETTCNGIVAPMFLLGESWITVTPGSATMGNTPSILKPMTKSNWSYTEPNELAKSGIYTQKETQALRQQLIFPIERPSMLTTIALSMSGKRVSKNGISVTHLFDEEEFTKLATNTWNKMWSQLTTFGSISAAVIGIIMIGRVVKFMVDTILHGYALYSLYGWSIKIIGAIWNSVTQLLLHAARDQPTRKQRKRTEEEGKEKDEDTTPRPPPAFPPPPPPPLPPQSSPLRFRPTAPTPPNDQALRPRLTAATIEKDGKNEVNITENKIYPNLLNEKIPPLLPPRNIIINKDSDTQKGNYDEKYI